MQSVIDKLQITEDQLNALYTACAVDCHASDSVEAEIRLRFSIPQDADWIDALEDRAVLTEAEAEWLRDA